MVSEADHTPSSELAPGGVLQSRFRVMRELGRGPVSVVYLAYDHQQREEVALKVLTLPAAERAQVRHEVMSVWDVVHDHVVAIQGCFETGGRCCVAMEHVAGPDLGSRAAARPLAPDEAAAVGRAIALGLQAAHRRGLLHRHVKPSNILIGPQVRARLADFGCSGLGRSTGAAPRPGDEFLAPEILAGQPADVRSDVYGLGMSLYFGLTGQLPTREGRQVGEADGQRAARLASAVPSWLDEAIAQATAALPADRFASAGKFAEALGPGGRRTADAAISVRM
jgi:serine/threonine protein kinase